MASPTGSGNYLLAFSKQLFTIVGYAYVDDCDLFQVGDDPVAVLTSMQTMINSWGGLMAVTGGSVRADKCWWYLLDFVWRRGKWICQDSDLDRDLVATSVNGEQVSLTRLRMNEAAEWGCIGKCEASSSCTP